MELSISPLQPDSNLISEKKIKTEWIISLFSLYHAAADGWNSVLGEENPLHHTSDCINREHFNRETVKYSRRVLDAAWLWPAHASDNNAISHQAGREQVAILRCCFLGLRDKWGFTSVGGFIAESQHPAGVPPKAKGLNLAGGLCNRIGPHPQTHALSTDEDIRAPAAPVS